jgi:hypothetical protein
MLLPMMRQEKIDMWIAQSVASVAVLRSRVFWQKLMEPMKWTREIQQSALPEPFGRKSCVTPSSQLRIENESRRVHLLSNAI